MPGFGSASFCKYTGIDVQCGPRGLRGAGDSLFHNNGDGTFTDVSKAAGVNDPNGYYGLGVMWADFNNTGRPDIYVANDSTPKFLYKNLGNGKFDDIGLESGTAVSEDGSEQASMGIAIGDYNHTGRPSIFVTNFTDENVLLYRNDGDWNFNEVSYPSGVALPSLPLVKWGTAFVDLDNDGWLDLIAVTATSIRRWIRCPPAPVIASRRCLSSIRKTERSAMPAIRRESPDGKARLARPGGRRSVQRRQHGRRS